MKITVSEQNRGDKWHRFGLILCMALCSIQLQAMEVLAPTTQLGTLTDFTNDNILQCENVCTEWGRKERVCGPNEYPPCFESFCTITEQYCEEVKPLVECSETTKTCTIKVDKTTPTGLTDRERFMIAFKSAYQKAQEAYVPTLVIEPGDYSFIGEPSLVISGDQCQFTQSEQAINATPATITKKVDFERYHQDLTDQRLLFEHQTNQPSTELDIINQPAIIEPGLAAFSNTVSAEQASADCENYVHQGDGSLRINLLGKTGATIVNSANDYVFEFAEGNSSNAAKLLIDITNVTFSGKAIRVLSRGNESRDPEITLLQNRFKNVPFDQDGAMVSVDQVALTLEHAGTVAELALNTPHVNLRHSSIVKGCHSCAASQVEQKGGTKLAVEASIIEQINFVKVCDDFDDTLCKPCKVTGQESWFNSDVEEDANNDQRCDIASLEANRFPSAIGDYLQFSDSMDYHLLAQGPQQVSNPLVDAKAVNSDDLAGFPKNAENQQVDLRGNKRNRYCDTSSGASLDVGAFELDPTPSNIDVTFNAQLRREQQCQNTCLNWNWNSNCGIFDDPSCFDPICTVWDLECTGGEIEDLPASWQCATGQTFKIIESVAYAEILPRVDITHPNLACDEYFNVPGVDNAVLLNRDQSSTQVSLDANTIGAGWSPLQKAEDCTLLLTKNSIVKRTLAVTSDEDQIGNNELTLDALSGPANITLKVDTSLIDKVEVSFCTVDGKAVNNCDIEAGINKNTVRIEDQIIDSWGNWQWPLTNRYDYFGNLNNQDVTFSIEYFGTVTLANGIGVPKLLKTETKTLTINTQYQAIKAIELIDSSGQPGGSTQLNSANFGLLFAVAFQTPKVQTSALNNLFEVSSNTHAIFNNNGSLTAEYKTKNQLSSLSLVSQFDRAVAASRCDDLRVFCFYVAGRTHMNLGGNLALNVNSNALAAVAGKFDLNISVNTTNVNVHYPVSYVGQTSSADEEILLSSAEKNAKIEKLSFSSPLPIFFWPPYNGDSQFNLKFRYGLGVNTTHQSDSISSWRTPFTADECILEARITEASDRIVGLQLITNKARVVRYGNYGPNETLVPVNAGEHIAGFDIRRQESKGIVALRPVISPLPSVCQNTLGSNAILPPLSVSMADNTGNTPVLSDYYQVTNQKPSDAHYKKHGGMDTGTLVGLKINNQFSGHTKIQYNKNIPQSCKQVCTNWVWFELCHDGASCGHWQCSKYEQQCTGGGTDVAWQNASHVPVNNQNSNFAGNTHWLSIQKKRDGDRLEALTLFNGCGVDKTIGNWGATSSPTPVVPALNSHLGAISLVEHSSGHWVENIQFYERGYGAIGQVPSGFDHGGINLGMWCGTDGWQSHSNPNAVSGISFDRDSEYLKHLIVRGKANATIEIQDSCKVSKSREQRGSDCLSLYQESTTYAASSIQELAAPWGYYIDTVYTRGVGSGNARANRIIGVGLKAISPVD